MEPSSALRKMCWRNLWQLVLAAAILSSCFLLIEGQGTATRIQIQVQPEHPIEGQNVTLTPKGNLSTGRVCRWYRGQKLKIETWIMSYFFISPQNSSDQFPGLSFTHRETTGPGCFLHIRKLTARDTGIYSVSADGLGLLAVGYASVVVSEYLSSPLLETSPLNGIVAEYSDAILTCHTSNQSDVNIFWLKNGNPLSTTVGELSNQNRILTFPHVAKSETGIYKCMAKNLISYNESNPVQILVTYGPEIDLNPEGIVFKPVNSEIFVECLVDSVPEAKLQWFFNGVKLKETGNVLKVRIRDQNSTGAYTCRATNPFTKHTFERSCYVILRKGHLNLVTLVGIIVGSVAGVAIFTVRLYFVIKSCSGVKVQPPTSSGEVEETPQAD